MASELAVTSAEFQSKVLDSPIPVLVDFWAEWCGPCRMIAPAIEELAKEYAGRAAVYKLDVDTNQDIAMKYQVMSIPTLLVFKGGKVVEQHVGAAPKQHLAQLIERHL
ncbi:MAG: thioredoxin [Fimbriimonadales bacterium]|nr:thioredoxin [Fimbriimonadales bacterium]